MMPMIVSWNLTRRCNLTCGHCYLDAVQRKREAPDELNTEEACGVIKQIAELAPGAMLVMTGGEPLLRRDLPVLVETAAQQGLMPVTGTNGTLLSAFRSAELKYAGAAGVGISLDSATPEFHDRLRGQRGAWAAAMEGVHAARQAGLAVLLQSTLFEENRENLILESRRALKTLLAANKRLNTAYMLKESFGQLWSNKREAYARRFFDNWRNALKWQRLEPYEKFAEMIEHHWDGIAAFCKPENKASLGFVEGLNNKNRVIQRRAYGLRDEEYLRLNILTCMLPAI